MNPKHSVTLTLLVVILIVVAGDSRVVAHPGHFHAKRSEDSQGFVRWWTNSISGDQIPGAFVSSNGDFVQIRRMDDSLVRLKLSELVDEDRAWVASRLEQIRVANRVFSHFLKNGERLRLCPKNGSDPSWVVFLIIGLTPGNGSDPFFGQSQRLLLNDVGKNQIPIEDRNNDSFVGQEPDSSVSDFEVAQQLPMLLAQLDRSKDIPGGGVVGKIPEIAKVFEAFVKAKAIRTRWDEKFFYIESNGIPDHRMMVGITAWQQQVPLPQAYTGENAWRIPLFPVPAKNPVSAKNRFLRGAIAIAVNGVPIFNPLNNRGDDAYLFGELDEFGGHCGRADDYHYHIAPVHLSKTIGEGLPIAFALDGYPIFGYEESDGSKVQGLDHLNGHKDRNGNYHYHATKTYPYLNGGFFGEVIERGGQVDPQPRAEPIRPDGRPLRDARITDFVETKPNSYVLTYEIQGKKGSVSYVLSGDGGATFTFTEPNGKSKTETYAPKRRGPAGNDRPSPPPPRNEPPPRRDDAKTVNAANKVTKPKSDLPQLILTSSAIDADGKISAEFTCDGASASPSVEWKGAPEGTRCFALSLWHIAPDQEKSYWVIYDIPANIQKIPKNSRDIGKFGLNDRQKPVYEPMCSKGPGLKTYHITVYALSAEPKLAADAATRSNLLEAIKGITLAEGTLDFQYERKR